MQNLIDIRSQLEDSFFLIFKKKLEKIAPIVIEANFSSLLCLFLLIFDTD